MAVFTIEELFKFYKRERVLNLTLEQFTLFVEFFPALMVIMSDGVVDSQEEVYVEKLAENMGNSYIDEGLSKKRIQDLKMIFQEEFKYLLQHMELWQDHFLNALRSYLLLYPIEKEIILETLYLFAKSTKPEWKEENNTIETLKLLLDL